jgi:hypothetical protein
MSGASLIISKRPTSFWQISQINLSPISLSFTHSQLERSRRSNTLLVRTRRPVENDGSLELTADFDALLARKFLPFPILRLLEKSPTVGIYSTETHRQGLFCRAGLGSQKENAPAIGHAEKPPNIHSIVCE